MEKREILESNYYNYLNKTNLLRTFKSFVNDSYNSIQNYLNTSKKYYEEDVANLTGSIRYHGSEDIFNKLLKSMSYIDSLILNLHEQYKDHLTIYNSEYNVENLLNSGEPIDEEVVDALINLYKNLNKDIDVHFASGTESDKIFSDSIFYVDQLYTKFIKVRNNLAFDEPLSLYEDHLNTLEYGISTIKNIYYNIEDFKDKSYEYTDFIKYFKEETDLFKINTPVEVLKLEGGMEVLSSTPTDAVVRLHADVNWQEEPLTDGMGNNYEEPSSPSEAVEVEPIKNPVEETDSVKEVEIVSKDKSTKSIEDFKLISLEEFEELIRMVGVNYAEEYAYTIPESDRQPYLDLLSEQDN